MTISLVDTNYTNLLEAMNEMYIKSSEIAHRINVTDLFNHADCFGVHCRSLTAGIHALRNETSAEGGRSARSEVRAS